MTVDFASDATADSSADHSESCAGVALSAMDRAGGAHNVLRVMCELAVDAIGGVEHAGVTVVRGARFTSLAASGAVPAGIDRIQQDTGDGPSGPSIRAHSYWRRQLRKTTSSEPAQTA